MKATQSLREQLGLSQEAMSQYLKISKSQLAMYEAGKRELPTAALVKLAEITLFFDQNRITQVDSELKNKQELELVLIDQIKELEFKQIREQRLLDAIQKKYHQNFQLHSLALHLQKSKALYADALLQQAMKGMKQNGLAKQFKQELKLEGIKSQLDYIHSLK